MSLTAFEIKNAKRGMHSDGGGLYLYVKPSGTRSWIYRYQLQGRRREMGLGSVAVLEPRSARAEAARLKVKVANGVDPLLEKQAVRAAVQEETRQDARSMELKAATFSKVAERHIAAQEAGWRNLKHRLQWESTLRTYAYPVIGDLPVSEISAQHVLEVLQPIWSTKPETAGRVRMRIEAVLNSAKLLGWRTGENPAAWRGGLEAVLPRLSRVKQVQHHAALDWREVPGFVAKLRDREGLSARALEFTILTAARSGEVRLGTWSELDLERGWWTLPAGRMKVGREHRVVLSSAAIELLKQLPRLDGSELLFPGMRGRALSDMSLSAVLKRMSVSVTVHGFRSSFRDWAAETTHHSPEVVEMALAHTVRNKVEAAYRRGDLLEKRRALMEDWAAWCAGVAATPASPED